MSTTIPPLPTPRNQLSRDGSQPKVDWLGRPGDAVQRPDAGIGAGAGHRVAASIMAILAQQ